MPKYEVFFKHTSQHNRSVNRFSVIVTEESEWTAALTAFKQSVADSETFGFSSQLGEFWNDNDTYKYRVRNK